MNAHINRPPANLAEATERLKERNDELERQSVARGSVPPPELVDLTEAEAVRIAAAVMKKVELFCTFSGVSPEGLLAFTRAAVRGART
jgi:hypothetical protein